MTPTTFYSDERGVALVISLMFLALLAMLGATAVTLTTTDMQIGNNYKLGNTAFFDADAGVNYAIAKMEAGLKNGTFPSGGASLQDMAVGATTSISSITAPSGFNFSYLPSGSPVLTKIAPNAYSFTTLGASQGNSTSTITVTIQQASAISFAAFGDTKLDTKHGGNTLSYKSSSSDSTVNDPDDASFSSTHEADVGSNDWLVSHNGANIDGDGVFGEQDDGSPTTDGIHGGTNFYGTDTPVNAGRIDPDPLGITTAGGEFNPATYATNNDNDDTSLVIPNGSLSSDTIDLGNGDHLTLIGKPGGSNFYVTSVDLKNGSTLTIDATNGRVNLFLTGPFDAKNGSTIEVLKSGVDTHDATSFSIFSNSTSKIDFKHSSSFTGFVYAPFAPIDVKNSADVYGAIWGDDVDIKNTGTIFYDAALKDAYLSRELEMTSWDDVRN